MATYVFSDVHGHFGTLDRLLERVSPGADDRIFMLGDMIDRGPDPMGVVKCCYNLPNTTVLMGNHEDLMLSYYADPTDLTAQMNWEINGAGPTQSGLRSLPLEERVELARWLFTLPLYAQTEVGGRRYLLVHAGIDPTRVEADGIEVWDEQALDDVVGNQYRDDLMWIPFKAKDSVSIARMSARESAPVLAMENILRDVIEEQEKHKNTKL